MKGIALFTCVILAQSLPDTEISAEDKCSGEHCIDGLKLNFPKTVYPVTPRFDFSISGKINASSPSFAAKGSLGLPHHPLGIFGFKQSGPACGEQKLYLEDGVLAVITVNFPPCPWTGDIEIKGHVDVWTTIPAIPVKPWFGVPTGFTLNMQVAEKADATQEHLALTVGLSQPVGDAADRDQDNCTLDFANMPAYPPPKSQPGISDTTIPNVVIDLDVDAKTRWDHVVRPRAKYINAMIQGFIDNLGAGKLLKNRLLMTILDLGAERLLKKVPAPYDDEIRGIAASTGIDIVKIFIYNIMYEVEGLCTSMVSQDSNGRIYHSRNLDFGLFDGTDNKTRTWSLSENLRPLLMNVNFVRGGVSVYNATQFAGFTGLLTGVKKDGFSLSVDTRFDGHLDEYLVLWLLGKYEGSFLSWKMRDTMENVDTYDNALHDLTSYKPMGPGYVILGGAKAGQGAAIALAAGKTTPQAVRLLSDAISNKSFYIVETNYDWGMKPPAFDDRRYPIEDCMNKLGSAKVAWNTLWAIHSSTPNKNAATTYTTLMSAQTGHFEAYKQFCLPGPHCMPFMGDSEGLFRATSLFTPATTIVV